MRSDACLHVPIRACLNLSAPMLRCSIHHPGCQDSNENCSTYEPKACRCNQSRFSSESTVAFTLKGSGTITDLLILSAGRLDVSSCLVYAPISVCGPFDPLPLCSAIEGGACLGP